MWWRCVALAWALALALPALGCRGGRVRYHAEAPTLPDGPQVRFKQIVAEADIIYVEMWITNGSKRTMQIDRDGMALRLPDGRVLRRAIGTFTRHNLYVLPPGGGHDVHVDFRDPGRDLRQNSSATLLLGGISFTDDPQPRVVAEIPMALDGPVR